MHIETRKLIHLSYTREKEHCRKKLTSHCLGPLDLYKVVTNYAIQGRVDRVSHKKYIYIYIFFNLKVQGLLNFLGTISASIVPKVTYTTPKISLLPQRLI